MTIKELENAMDRFYQITQGLQKSISELREKIARIEDDLETLKRRP